VSRSQQIDASAGRAPSELFPPSLTGRSSRARRRTLAGSCCVAVAALVAVSTSTAASSGVLVSSAHNPTLGATVLVSAGGRTLYRASGESKNAVKCTGYCATDWRPLVVTAGAKPVAGKGVRASLLGTVRRPDGKVQVTYAGMPLYLYTGDRKPGSVSGQGVGAVRWLGGTWNAISPSGAVVKALPESESSGTNGGTTSPAPVMTCY
jgi:predicted lipoprotein with Yx(FWY)xxD motif